MEEEGEHKKIEKYELKLKYDGKTVNINYYPIKLLSSASSSSS